MMLRPMYHLLAAGIELANVCLLVTLLVLYIKSYRQVKSKFTKGLITFASLFLLHHFLAIVFLLGHRGMRYTAVGPPMLILGVVQLIALIILVKISWE